MKKTILRAYQIAAIRAIRGLLTVRRALLGRDVVVDEAHHVAASFGPWPVGGGMVIGFTATPARADAAKLTDLVSL